MSIASAIGPLMRAVWPHIVGWGVNRLFNSAFGRTYIPNALQPHIRDFASTAINFLPKPKNVIAKNIKFTT